MRKILGLLSGTLLVLQLLISASPVAAIDLHFTHDACPPEDGGFVRCHAHIATNQYGKPLVTTSYSKGLTPADLQSAYKLPGTPGGAFAWNGQTVAVVDAYDDPNALSDLTMYRRQFGLPLCSDGTASCILTKVNGNGSGKLPAASVSWSQEISLDLDMVSATCPSCKILLVEAATSSMANLAQAEDTAAALGATQISNSYGGREFSTEVNQDVHFNHPGIAITVSSGDSGYGVQYPAASPYVTAVGGTSLTKSATARGWTETVWGRAGSGCSRYERPLAWQTQIGTCKKRMVSDVSAVADPVTGVAVYDSYGSSRTGSWYVMGGTSAGAPIIASVYALANVSNHTGFTYGELPYAHTGNLFDVTAGKNGACSTSLKALCTAFPGYDGPTGLGTPNGLGAF